MIWFVAAPLVSRGVKVVATFVGGLAIVILMGAPMLGLFLQPMSRWWFGQQPGSGAFSLTTPLVDAPVVAVPVVTQPVTVAAGAVSDVERYLLAIGAGFTGGDAITAVAVSIAEDGSGNPSALSASNFNGTRDVGLWQINTIWWAQFGGEAALTNPVTNSLAAHYVFERQGWCAWSTYLASCGSGHNGAFAAFMGRARVAAGG